MQSSPEGQSGRESVQPSKSAPIMAKIFKLMQSLPAASRFDLIRHHFSQAQRTELEVWARANRPSKRAEGSNTAVVAYDMLHGGLHEVLRVPCDSIRCGYSSYS